MTSIRNIDLDLVDEGVNAHHWLSNEASIIKGRSCQDSTLNDAHFEDSVAKGLLLSIKHSTSSKQGQRVYYNSAFNSNNSFPSKRQKRMELTSYDRLLVFADLADPPNCFAMFCKNTHKAYQLLEFCKETIAVGRIFYIIEPERTDASLGGKIPIISTTRPLIPIKYSAPQLSIVSSLPTYNMSLPKEPGEQVYFINHQVKISLTRFELVTKGVSCRGLLCDRTQEAQPNVSCGCLFEGDKGSCVGEYTITMPVPTSINVRGKELIPKCRSFRTTRFFFKNPSAFGSLPEDTAKSKFALVRSRVRTMVDYVNSNGGWTIVGWFKKGEVQDASSVIGEKIESSTISLHVSLLMPTNEALANGDDNAFSDMQIDASEGTQSGNATEP